MVPCSRRNEAVEHCPAMAKKPVTREWPDGSDRNVHVITTFLLLLEDHAHFYAWIHAVWDDVFA
jgi:hypothetical protein